MIEEKTSETKKKNKGVKAINLRFLFVLFFLGFVVIRGLSLLPGWGNIVDTYGFYSAAVIEQEQMLARLSSGISYAYTESLVDLMRIVGNVKWFVAVYHILLQIVTLVLLMLGCNMLFDKVTACVSSICMMISPWLFKSIFLVSPENYYLFFWSVVFCLVGIYFRKGRKNGWCRNNTGEGFLLLLGFLTGILCVWHYFSFTLIVLIIYAMIRNSSYVKERVKTRQNLLDMEMLAETEQGFDAKDDKLDEKDDPMSNATQMMIVFSGIFLGGYCTLMKYTGITGNFIGAQFKWWLSKLTLFGKYGRWQDIALWLFIQVAVIIIVGMIMVAVNNSKENVQEIETKDSLTDNTEISVPEDIASELPVEEENWRFAVEVIQDDNWRFDDKDDLKEESSKAKSEIKEDIEMKQVKKTVKKEVELLDNPLPLPKKHEKKVMDFDDNSLKDDFDYVLREDDDFDV